MERENLPVSGRELEQINASLGEIKLEARRHTDSTNNELRQLSASITDLKVRQAEWKNENFVTQAQFTKLEEKMAPIHSGFWWLITALGTLIIGGIGTLITYLLNHRGIS